MISATEPKGSLCPPGSIEGPKHVAIIMDGNNRWAKDRNLTGAAGHQAGADRLQEIVQACSSTSIETLTVFAFSSENWARSKQEVGGLMSLFASALKRYKKELVKQDIRLQVIGRRDRFSERLNKLIVETETATREGVKALVVAADYGGRWDITEATKQIVEQIDNGELQSSDITEDLFDQHCQLSQFPPVDLLIRTGAEYRISNFLLWQISYAELYFANCYWPDFDSLWLQKAIDEFNSRQRRFGANFTDTYRLEAS